jgi:tetrahydromethanopterin S-methyltransferase subunit F
MSNRTKKLLSLLLVIGFILSIVVIGVLALLF